MFQNLFLSVSNAETLYYFYYFFEKSRATVAHFFSTVISLLQCFKRKKRRCILGEGTRLFLLFL